MNRVITSFLFKNWLIRIMVILSMILCPLISNWLSFDQTISHPSFYLFIGVLSIVLFSLNLLDYFGSRFLKKSQSKFSYWLFFHKLFNWEKTFFSRNFKYNQNNYFMTKNKSLWSFPFLFPFITIPFPLFVITFISFVVSIVSFFYVNWNGLWISLWFILFTSWIVIITNLYCFNVNDSLIDNNLIYKNILCQLSTLRLPSDNKFPTLNRFIWWLFLLIIFGSLNFLIGGIILGTTNILQNPWSVRSIGVFQAGGILFNGYNWTNGILQFSIGTIGFIAVCLLWIGISLPTHFLNEWKNRYLIYSFLFFNFLGFYVYYKNRQLLDKFKQNNQLNY